MAKVIDAATAKPVEAATVQIITGISGIAATQKRKDKVLAF